MHETYEIKNYRVHQGEHLPSLLPCWFLLSISPQQTVTCILTHPGLNSVAPDFHFQPCILLWIRKRIYSLCLFLEFIYGRRSYVVGGGVGEAICVSVMCVCLDLVH